MADDDDFFPVLATSYLMGALLRLDAHVLEGGAHPVIELAVPAGAVPDFDPGTAAECTVRFVVR